MYYAGIGAREITPELREEFISIGQTLAERGLILRSGGAEGADKAFEDGCRIANGKKEIFYLGGASIIMIVTLY